MQTTPESGRDESADRTRQDVDREMIAQRAYERYQARGGEHGRDQEDWFEAEREIRGASSE